MLALLLQVGGSTVAAAITEATGVSRARIREMYQQLGDLGDVAAKCKLTQVGRRWLAAAAAGDWLKSDCRAGLPAPQRALRPPWP